jgi:hypothetical protein
MTVIGADLDEDGWPDIFVACDSTLNLLFINNHDGTFREEGVLRGWRSVMMGSNRQAGASVSATMTWTDTWIDSKHILPTTPARFIATSGEETLMTLRMRPGQAAARNRSLVRELRKRLP